MAEHGQMNIKGHEKTYDGFLVVFKWGAVASFVVAAIVVVLIAS